MRFTRTGSCITAVGVYLALRFTMATVRPGHLDPRLAIFLSIAVLMLVQLAVVASIAGLQVRLKRALLLFLTSTGIVVGITLALGKCDIHSNAGLAAASALRDLALMVSAAFFGCAVSSIVRERNILLPAAIFAALVDLWTLTLGPLGYMLEHKPEFIEAVAVHMPTPVPGGPETMIGVGDFVFLALFFRVLFKFSMNVSGAFWLGYFLLTVSMLVVAAWDGIAIPALVPMAIGILGANAGHFKLKRQELLATLYVGALLLVILVASAFLLR